MAADDRVPPLLAPSGGCPLAKGGVACDEEEAGLAAGSIVTGPMYSATWGWYEMVLCHLNTLGMDVWAPALRTCSKGCFRSKARMMSARLSLSVTM